MSYRDMQKILYSSKQSLDSNHLSITCIQKIDSITSFRKGDTDQSTLIMIQNISSTHQYM